MDPDIIQKIRDRADSMELEFREFYGNSGKCLLLCKKDGYHLHVMDTEFILTRKYKCHSDKNGKYHLLFEVM
jgi:hypothetical protein